MRFKEMESFDVSNLTRLLILSLYPSRVMGGGPQGSKRDTRDDDRGR